MVLILVLFTQIYSAELKSVVLCFDDAYYSVYKYGFPLLKEYKIPITLGVITNYLNRSQKPRKSADPYQFMNIGEIKEMRQQLNIEIASHSVSHRNLVHLAENEIKFELEYSKHVLDSIFGEPTITFIYPYGRFNNQVINLVKKANYQLARAVLYGEPNLWVGRYTLAVKEVRKETTINEIIDFINHNKTTILLFHRLAPNPKVFTEWSVDNFHALLKYLRTNNFIRITTLKELYYDWCQTKLLAMARNSPHNDYLNLFQKVDIDQTRTRNPSIIK
ncbi:MAG: polysaccharide deacetylase family protein [candidate division WOR-3 bacterium]|nr:polysaccharide deacetylase family protein [candidate division WOR-3 bacterium]MDW7987921.1 polysaccharide deacetylase family protein [candidate division WOR-3 bacterium]